MKSTLLEAGCLALGGLLVALAANGLSPRGLKLTRDYFPQMARAIAPSVVPATNGAAANPIAARLRNEGLQPSDGDAARQMFAAPEYAQAAFIFIDARDDEHYQAGHVPGAYQFDRYHPENYLAEVLPACQRAQKIMVYCRGGECEDSEFAALFLRDSAGVAKEKLFVYEGGWLDWTNRARPAIETGARNSGQRK